jgi:c-di-GMP-binding flagellar brake protein YcgR
MNEERRQYPRYRIDQLIELSFGRETFLNAEGMNMSEGGLLCVTDSYVEPYSSVFLMLGIPVNEDAEEYYEVKCEGIVLRCNQQNGSGYYVGIRFTDIMDFDREKIQKFIELAGGKPEPE